MISNNDKPRPVDGTGSNGLRGGKQLYSNKTALGGWLDDVGGPSGFQRGFHSEDFVTTSQQQQQGVIVARKGGQQRYGAALPAAIETKPPSVADIFQNSGNKKHEWTTTTRNMMSRAGEQVPVYNLPTTSSTTREALEKYRKTWTTDSDLARSIRYQTESRRAGNATPNDFQVNSLRLLPGTPKQLERFRERLVEKYGILALTALRHALGSGLISSHQLRSAIATIDVPITRADFSQVRNNQRPFDIVLIIN